MDAFARQISVFCHKELKEKDPRNLSTSLLTLVPTKPLFSIMNLLIVQSSKFVKGYKKFHGKRHPEKVVYEK